MRSDYFIHALALHRHHSATAMKMPYDIVLCKCRITNVVFEIRNRHPFRLNRASATAAIYRLRIAIRVCTRNTHKGNEITKNAKIQKKHISAITLTHFIHVDTLRERGAFVLYTYANVFIPSYQ